MELRYNFLARLALLGEEILTGNTTGVDRSLYSYCPGVSSYAKE